MIATKESGAKKLSILVVEDEELTREVMAERLVGQRVEFAADVAEARRKLNKGQYDLCFIDLELGPDDNCSGLEVIPLAVARGTYAVVMSGHDSDGLVERAYSLGCRDFYAKGNEGANIEQILLRFAQGRGRGEKDTLFTERFVTQDAETKAEIEAALKYAASDLPVMLLGPSGTGKTSLAKVIHDFSGRTGQFVSINCSAHTDELLEAELFGFRRGAFTGANESRKGKLQLANEGTLFLDEIGSMSLKMQTKLLKAIEERSFYPLGADKPEHSQFRIISATLEDVQALVSAGKLRFDFYQRIHGLTIRLKPLAERKQDILPMLAAFTRGGKRLSFASEAREKILAHDWPGNVRELKKFVELLGAGTEGQVTAEVVDRLLNAVRVQESGDFLTKQQYRFAREQGLHRAMERFVDEVIKRSLSENQGNKAKVKAALKITHRILYNALARIEKDVQDADNERQ